MRRWMIATLLTTLLGACVVTPVGYRYHDGGYYGRYGYTDDHRDRDRYRGTYRHYDDHPFYDEHGR